MSRAVPDAVVRGLDGGVKVLSEINMVLAALLLIFVLFTGTTVAVLTGFYLYVDIAISLGLVGFLLSGIFASYGKLTFLYLQLVLIWVLCDLAASRLSGPPMRTGNPRPAV